MMSQQHSSFVLDYEVPNFSHTHQTCSEVAIITMCTIHRLGIKRLYLSAKFLVIEFQSFCITFHFLFSEKVPKFT